MMPGTRKTPQRASDFDAAGTAIAYVPLVEGLSAQPVERHPGVVCAFGGGLGVNYLYYGDNLDVLRRHIKDETVDLVYLDPPFNSNASYNVLFSEHNGTKSAAQAKAFEDTWAWNEASALVFQETVERPGRVSELLQTYMGFLGTSNMLAYLTMMAPRLMELRRVLKPAGSCPLPEMPSGPPGTCSTSHMTGRQSNMPRWTKAVGGTS